MPSPWQELEIEPTADVLAIRRAYRARLDPTKPEEAARLQAAYENAIAALPLSPGPAKIADASRAACIGDAIAGGRAVEAADLIANGRAQSTLTLRDDIEAVERLLALLATDRSIRHSDLGRVADTLGWLQNGELPAGSVFDPLRARFAAERWFETVRSDAARRRPFDARTAAARHLLGRRSSIIWRLFPPRLALAALLSELEQQRPWIGDRLDPAVIENARRIAGPAR